MPDPIPPPGPERDAEICRALGMLPCDDPIGRCDAAKLGQCWRWPDEEHGAQWCWSIDPALAVRLIAILRGRDLIVDFKATIHWVSARVSGEGWVGREVCGEYRFEDAVSAAALLALRSQR